MAVADELSFIDTTLFIAILNRYIMQNPNAMSVFLHNLYSCIRSLVRIPFSLLAMVYE